MHLPWENTLLHIDGLSSFIFVLFLFGLLIWKFLQMVLAGCTLGPHHRFVISAFIFALGALFLLFLVWVYFSTFLWAQDRPAFGYWEG